MGGLLPVGREKEELEGCKHREVLTRVLVNTLSVFL